MQCDNRNETLVLAAYGELPDDELIGFELHLESCQSCRAEWADLQQAMQSWASFPLADPSPNLLIAARINLDEQLNALSGKRLFDRILVPARRWSSLLKSSPALVPLLLGLGCLGGDLLSRIQARQEVPPVFLSTPGQIQSVSSVTRTPGSDRVQVTYNRVVSEAIQGSPADPQIQQLLMIGTRLAANTAAHADSVSVLSTECQLGRACDRDGEARSALVKSLRSDRSSKVRLQALSGLQPYVSQDAHVRDAVLETLMRDQDLDVRTKALSLLEPVGADSTVRQVLRSVSSQDANPALRTASFHALQGTADIE